MEEKSSMLKIDQILYHKSSQQFESDKLKFRISSNSSKSLSIFDAKTKRIDELELQIDKELNIHGSKCLLPDGSLYYHYGSVSYIIDPLNNIKYINTNKKTQYGCSFYYDGFVYLIGGLHHESGRYKINEGQWYKLTPHFDAWTPGQVGPLFKNYVFLWSCKTNNVYIYDIYVDSFSDLSIPLVAPCKLFIISFENIYAIDNERYLYSNDGDLGDWKSLGQLIVEGCNFGMNSSPIYYEGKVYYANWSGIFRFDLKKKKLKNVIYFNKHAGEHFAITN